MYNILITIYSEASGRSPKFFRIFEEKKLDVKELFVGFS